ncbi:DUF2399 domain-containing protein [Streptomyces sp. NPDC000983]|uniref:DUF2399 domain-containing protein n=1 Tax=Streptomyces sp. NPDC000983 TaxID=3154373 RepID=UPI00331951D9
MSGRTIETAQRPAALGRTTTGTARGTPATAAWDQDMPAALAEPGVRLEEENVLDALLADLVR